MAIVSLSVGSLLILGGGWATHHMHLDEAIFRRATAQGVVIENQHLQVSSSSTGRSSGLGGTSYRAVVRFPVEGGRFVVVPDNVSFSPASFRVGQGVTIFYDPQEPLHMMIDRGWRNYLVLGIPGLMGFFMLLGGVQRLLKARREEQIEQ